MFMSPKPILAYRRLPYLLALATAFLLLHALAMLVFTDASDALSYIFVVAPPLLAIHASWRFARSSHGPLRLRWFLVLASIVIWDIGMLNAFIQQFHLPRWPHVNPFVYGAVAQALRLMAFSSPPEEQRSIAVRSIDVSLTTLICILAFVDLYVPLNGVNLFGHPNFVELTVAAKFFVAMAASIAMYSFSTPQEHHFGKTVCCFVWTDAVCFFINNYIIYARLHWYHHSPFDSIISIPYLAFALFASLPNTDSHSTTSAISKKYLVRSAMPLLLALGVFVLATRFTLIYPLAGFACIGTTMMISGLRIAITQSQYMKVRDYFKEQTLLDPLTEVGNRRSFELCLDKEWSLIQRSNDFIALLLLDLDHFKQVNDEYGHQHGDTCLLAVAQCIRNALPRNTDSVYRYGGEEFAVVLPLTKLEGALLVAERIRKDVIALPIRGTTDSPITVSIGVAVHGPLDYITSNLGLIEVADRALYKAKSSGRNRVEFLPSSAMNPPAESFH